MDNNFNFRDINIDEVIKKGIDDALIGLANIAVSQARYLVPVDTGRLKNSITWKKKGQQNKVSGNNENDTISEPTEELQIAFGTNVEYAPFVEYGTDKMAARPFIAPAKVKVEREIEKGYVYKKIMQAIKRAGGI